VDVGGHVLVVTQWDREGLFAIDGHPDFSVTRRHFSDVYFRFFRGTRTGGFKAFRYDESGLEHPATLVHHDPVPPLQPRDRIFDHAQVESTETRTHPAVAPKDKPIRATRSVFE